MDFYYARYQTEKFYLGKWQAIPLDTGTFIVIAENLENATEKINICLIKESNQWQRRILISDVCRCDGLRIIDHGDECSYTHPIR